MRLMKSTARGASDAEPSHSAESTVRKMLEGNRSSLEGLDELLREHYTINSNQDILNAIKPYLLDKGFTDEQIETARTDLHNLHQQQGWY